MKKLILNFDEPNEMSAIGISCQLADYKLLFNINKTLKIGFKRVDSFSINVAKFNGSFSLYYFNDLPNQRKIYLLSNKIKETILIAELKQFDYFFIIDNITDGQYLKETIKKIRSISQVVFTQGIDITNIKDFDDFSDTFMLHIDSI